MNSSGTTCTNTAAAQVEDAGQKCYDASRLKDRIPFLTAWDTNKGPGCFTAVRNTYSYALTLTPNITWPTGIQAQQKENTV